MSWYRFAFRDPGALVWASSSTSASSGARLTTASTSISSISSAPWLTRSRGTTSSPSASAAVAGRSWGSR